MDVTIVYNKPNPSHYKNKGEEKAVLGVINAVEAVQRALVELGYKVELLPLAPPLEQAEQRLMALKDGLVFNLFEGFCGHPETESMVPQFLSERGIPYTGCPSRALSLALDKAGAKRLLRKAGIPTPDFQVADAGSLRGFRLRFPCIVKPQGEDASHGITETSVVAELASLEMQVRAIVDAYGSALVEEFIDGREFNATVLGNSEVKVLPVSEIVYSLPPEMPRILTYAAKWEPDSPYYRGSDVVCPAPVDDNVKGLISRTALDSFRLLGCRGYARVDMRMDGGGRVEVIEVNPNPDISPDAGAARQAKAAGMTYSEFIKKIVELALEKEKH